MFIDTHAHVFKEYYENIDDLILNAKNNNIKIIINAGCDRTSNEEVISLSTKYDILYAAIGIHPEFVLDYDNDDLNFIEEHIFDDKVIAIGEIGLDYSYSKENKQKQIELFERQLFIAQKYNIPVVVHSREATEDTINCLKKYKVRGVIHCFSGSLETARIYSKMGFYLGINGVITFKNCNLKEIYKSIDINRILLETDSPYLTPVPYRGKQNSPSHIIDIANFVKDIYGVSLDELSKITNENAYSLFDKLN